MTIWIFVLIGVMILMVLGLVYLISKVTKIPVISKWAKDKKAVKVLISLGIILLFSIIVGFLMGMVNAIVAILHLVAFLLISDLIILIIRKIRGKRIDLKYGNLAAVLFTVLYLCAGWFMAHNVWTTNYDIETSKNVTKLRVVQFADSHVGTTFTGLEFEKYVDRMQGENPDVVVITGDFVDDDTSRTDMVNACAALGKLKTTYGVYYSFGNHDKGYYGSENRGYSGNDLIAELQKNGVKVLQDETVNIGDSYYIIGRQDKSEELNGGHRASMDQLTANLDKSKYMICLDHQPNDYDNEAASDVDLVLSGHTHGGQLIPVNYVGEWTKTNDFTYGMTEINSTKFIVTSGISDWALDFKTGCKSEYVVIDINKK